MATVPTGKMERELRALYVRWLQGMPTDPGAVQEYINKFRDDSLSLIATLGGQAASRGALAGFPVPKLLDLSLHAGTVYDEMQKAAIQASLAAGLNAKDVAKAMIRTGVGKEYYKLERLARTETVSAYWKNQWDSAAGLDLVMVWSSEEGPRTCDFCLDRDGLVVEDSSIRDHPNGRCTLLPTLPQDVAYKGTLQPDGSVYMDPKWSAPAAVDTTGGDYQSMLQQARMDAQSNIEADELEWLDAPGRESLRDDRIWRDQNQRLQDQYFQDVGLYEPETLSTYFNNDDSFLINEALRDGTGQYPELEDVFNRWSLPESTVTYRGVWDMDLPDDMVGAVWEDKGIQSTTFNRDRAYSWAGTRGEDITVFEIVSPKGTKVGLDPVQEELALAPGSSIKIVEQTTTDYAGRTVRVLKGYVIQ